MAYDRIMDFPGLFKDHFLPDKLHNINVSFTVDTFSENFGGTAGNIAYSLALLGVTPKILATAGADFDRYSAHLKKNNIDPTSVHIDPKLPTSSAFVVTDKGDNQIAAFSVGAGATAYTPLPVLQDAACAIIGAGNERDMQSLPTYYRSHQLPYLYDPAQRIPMLAPEDLQDGITGAAVLFGNDYELGLIMEKTGWKETALVEKCGLVVITYGEQGTRILAKEGEWRVLAVPAVEVIDPTGAGDAYRAGFIAGFMHGLAADKSAQIASTVAVYAVEQYGTQNHHFTKQELAARYKENYGEDFPI